MRTKKKNKIPLNELTKWFGFILIMTQIIYYASMIKH